jgi:hypothetical protein
VARDGDPGASFPDQDRRSRNACFRLDLPLLGNGWRDEVSSGPVCLQAERKCPERGTE